MMADVVREQHVPITDAPPYSQFPEQIISATRKKTSPAILKSNQYNQRK